MSIEVGKKIIDKMGEHLLDYGFQVQKMEEKDQDVATLKCGFVLSSGYPMFMDVNFYQLADYSVLEYYVYVRGMVEADLKEKIESVIQEANAFAPAGHFGYHEDDLFFRHGVAIDGEDVERLVEYAENALELVISVLDMEIEKMGLAEELKKAMQED